MNKQYYIDIFSSLGERLKEFLGSPLESILERAIEANGWFTRGEIMVAIDAICSGMLERNILEKWLLGVNLSYSNPKQVAIIMAGNIPLVGFSDLMYVVASGNAAYVKLSSKDKVLLNYIIELLREIAPNIAIYEYSPEKKYDAVIATGSDSTGVYFRTAFADTPNIIRGSRSSVAILTNDDTDSDLKLLGNDIFLYSGMGCRNVSLIFVPHNYDIRRAGEVIATQANPDNRKYYNNYRAMRAKLMTSGAEFIDCGSFIITKGSKFPFSLSNVVVAYYNNLPEVYDWLNINDSAIQCIVGGADVCYPRKVGFGQAQIPNPWDYPDGVDVVRFLSEIQ